MNTTGSPSASVFIVDDSSILVASLVRILLENKRFSISGTLSTSKNAAQTVNEANPDILIIDMYMPGKGGIEVIKELRLLNNHCKILALSVCEEGETVSKAIESGAHGYISKLRGIDSLIPVLEKLLNGETYFTDEAILLAA